MKINLDIFKSYDVRGIYPSELNDEAAFEIGRAFIQYTGAKNVVVGRDMRLSSPKLHEALVRGILSQGANVYDIGQVATEVLYFAMGSFKYDGGIMVTASHNPKDYNGFKMMQKTDSNFSIIRGKDLLGVVNAGNFKESEIKGVSNEIDVWKDYINHAFSFIDVAEARPFKVVIDTGNGMMGKLIPMIAPILPIEIVHINSELDGNFPNHPSNVLEKGATDQIGKKILEEKADFGFIFDGDGDRAYLMDEKGRRVLSDVAFLPLVKYFLDKVKGETFVLQLVASKSIDELVKKWGGKTVRVPVGFVNIKDAMIKENGAVACEITGHYCFRDNFFSDSSLLAILILLKAISGQDKSVSEFFSQFSLFCKPEEINFKVKDKDAIIAELKNKYSDGTQNFMDGITVGYKDWWFNVRPSNTEPLLRLNIEADTQELLAEKQKEISKLIK